ncbi:MAG TPA: prepilin peptidase, partial [Jatrophihabitans sp.]|nr:prepilin peptidase [Jatrophihabitans sp.]
IGTALVVIDYEQHRLPDRLVVPLAATAAALLTLAALVRTDWSALGRAGAGAAAAFGALLVVELAGSGAFGFGDVKLGGVLGGYLGWFGWAEVLWGIFAGFLIGALAALALVVAGRATLRTRIAFGPALVVGALLVLALGR